MFIGLGVPAYALDVGQSVAVFSQNYTALCFDIMTNYQ